MPSLPASFRLPLPEARWQRWAIGIGAVAGLLLLLLATFDFALLRGLAERRLSKSLHRRVTVGGIARLDPVSFRPRLMFTGVRIAQPRWAGTGDMLVLDKAVVRISVLGALFGRLNPSLLSVEGARATLVHAADDRANWQDDKDSRQKSDSTSPDLTTIVLRDVRFTLDDRRRMLRLGGSAASDGRGVAIRATGTHRGAPASFALTGAPVLGGTAGKPWPFRADFTSPLAHLRVDATADRPLDFSRFAGAIDARGDDLKHLDDILLIGLIPTRPVTLAARLTRRDGHWRIDDARFRIGRSDLSGRIVVDKRAERTNVDAQLRSTAFDFDDLDNAAGHAAAAAKTARIGERIVPDTRIDLSKLRRLDGRLAFTAAHVVSDKKSLIRSLSTVVTLDHATLTVSPLVFGLPHGRLEGRAVVTQPEGQAQPQVRLALAMVGGRLEDIVAGGQIAGPLRGRLTLTGRGETLRSALAHADGSLALASRGGAITRAAAELLGRNLGSAFGLLVGGSDERTPLRCFAARFAARRGRLDPTLFTVDTGVMRADGRGRIDLDGETVALRLDGRSKHPGLIRLAAPIDVRGTLSHPVIETQAAGIASPKTVFKALGQAIGRLFKPREAPVPDVDCGALMARAGV